MAHAPEDQGSDQLIADARQAVARFREHEQKLRSLVTALEARGPSTVWATLSRVGPPTASHLDSGIATASSADLLAFVRGLCLAAGEQRQRIESLVAGMRGDSVVRNTDRVRVLVVDDSDDNRELATAVLEAAGFTSSRRATDWKEWSPHIANARRSC